MASLQKKKLNINFQSSGAFLSLNKPKLLSIGKSYDIKNIKIKKTNHNISQETFPMENITRQTDSSSKDEIIRALKERLTVLESKVKVLEKENINNTTKINTLNLSHGQAKKKIALLPQGLKLNMKLVKNKKNFLNIMNISKTYAKKIKNNNNNIISLNNSNSNYNNFNNNNTIEEKKNNGNKSRNIFETINSSGFNVDNNKGNRINNSASKYKNNKKLFIDVLRRTMTKCSIPNFEKFKKINDVKFESNKTIPKIPMKGRKHKSEIINIKLINKLTKYNNDKRLKYKQDFIIINNTNFKDDKSNVNGKANKSLSFKNIKDKLEDIKSRTKNLLEFYSSNKNDNNNNYYLTSNNATIDHENNKNKESFSSNYKYET
jgi:hypothetical protein